MFVTKHIWISHEKENQNNSLRRLLPGRPRALQLPLHALYLPLLALQPPPLAPGYRLPLAARAPRFRRRLAARALLQRCPATFPEHNMLSLSCSRTPRCHDRINADIKRPIPPRIDANVAWPFRRQTDYKRHLRDVAELIAQTLRLVKKRRGHSKSYRRRQCSPKLRPCRCLRAPSRINSEKTSRSPRRLATERSRGCAQSGNCWSKAGRNRGERRRNHPRGAAGCRRRALTLAILRAAPPGRRPRRPRRTRRRPRRTRRRRRHRQKTPNTSPGLGLSQTPRSIRAEAAAAAPAPAP